MCLWIDICGKCNAWDPPKAWKQKGFGRFQLMQFVKTDDFEEKRGHSFHNKREFSKIRQLPDELDERKALWPISFTYEKKPRWHWLFWKFHVYVNCIPLLSSCIMNVLSGYLTLIHLELQSRSGVSKSLVHGSALVPSMPETRLCK